MKKCFLLMLAVLLAATLSACSIADYLPLADTPKVVETVNPYLEIIPDSLTYSEGYEPVESSYSYDVLPLEGQKQLYQKLLEACYDIAPDADESWGVIRCRRSSWRVIRSRKLRCARRRRR